MRIARHPIFESGPNSVSRSRICPSPLGQIGDARRTWCSAHSRCNSAGSGPAAPHTASSGSGRWCTISHRGTPTISFSRLILLWFTSIPAGPHLGGHPRHPNCPRGRRGPYESRRPTRCRRESPPPLAASAGNAEKPSQPLHTGEWASAIPSFLLCARVIPTDSAWRNHFEQAITSEPSARGSPGSPGGQYFHATSESWQTSLSRTRATVGLDRVRRHGAGCSSPEVQVLRSIAALCSAPSDRPLSTPRLLTKSHSAGYCHASLRGDSVVAAEPPGTTR